MSTQEEKVAWEVLSNRAMGTVVPISIATALAIESTIGQHPEMPTEDPEIKRNQNLLINLRTLYRNLIGSIDKEQRGKLYPEILAEVMANEIRAIESALIQVANGRCGVQVYLCSYDGLRRRYPKALLRTATTDLQIAQLSLETATVKAFVDNHVDQVDFIRTDMDFEQDDRDTLIITHYPVDLLQRYRFRKLTLLESHTGKHKPPLEWYTKLGSGKDLARMPFDRMTLQLFGDGVMFHALGTKYRRHLIELADSHNWTPATTKDLIIRDVEMVRSVDLETQIKDLYSA